MSSIGGGFASAAGGFEAFWVVTAATTLNVRSVDDNWGVLSPGSLESESATTFLEPGFHRILKEYT